MTAVHLKAPEQTGRKIAYQYPAFGQGQPTLFWAHNGLVAFEDRRSGRCGTMSWQDAARRRLHVSAMMPKAEEDPKKHFLYERNRQLKFLEAMEEVIREAKIQGGPFDDQPNYGRPKKLKPSPVRIADEDLARLGTCDF